MTARLSPLGPWLSLPPPPFPDNPAPLSWQEHDHAFVAEGSEVRTARVVHRRGAQPEVIAGLRGWRVLKTTQSGYAGFLHDRYTTLPDSHDRIVATAITAHWRQVSGPLDWLERSGLGASRCQAWQARPGG
jgi:urate oxidase